MDCWQNCSVKGGLIMDKLGTTQVANVGSKKIQQDHFTQTSFKAKLAKLLQSLSLAGRLLW
jgi:hypothetical protein